MASRIALDIIHSKYAVFQQAPNFCTKFDLLNIFLNEELHIILKRRNLEICKHSSFLIIDETVF